MRRILLICLTACFMGNAQLALSADQKPEVLGILFYADWCGSCKILDPEIEKARGKSDLDNDAILFVRLDLTDATRRHQSELMAHALGVGDFYQENGGATGFMLLVDAETKEVISKLTKSMDSADITVEIHDAIAKAAS